MTPRAQDTTGLSTFDSIEAVPGKSGDRVQVIQTGLFKQLTAVADGSRGHYSVTPRDPREIPAWAATRESPITHPYTKELVESLMKTPRKKP